MRKLIVPANSTNVDISVPISIAVSGTSLSGDLVVPKMATGIVLFAHGSGSSRHSPRNKFVAKVLQSAGLATLLIDLLSETEEQIDARTAALRFDIEALSNRLVEIIDWLVINPQTEGLKIGLFGASTGAAAAIVAATRREKWINAVVSRGGRPDLANTALSELDTPTLLIVGSDDFQVLELNQQALALIQCQKQLSVVRGATHLFEEPGTLEDAARLAQEWFSKYLR
jgi:dienelactone hydrolase